MVLAVTSEPCIQQLCVCRDSIGCTWVDYERMMEQAFMVCSEASAAEAPEHERITQHLQRLRQQLKECQEMHDRAIMSDVCFEVVHRGLSSELQSKEQQLASTAQAITIGEDSVRRYKKALMFVLKSVAEGCSRKRPRIQ